MFKCGLCKTVQPAGVKPTMTITAECDKVYENIVTRIDSETLRTSKEHVHSAGTEILVELAFCPSCAGLKMETPPPVDLRGFKAITQGCHRHMRGDGNKLKPCKARNLDDCKICKSIVQGFASFPPHILSECLQDIKVRPLMTPLGKVMAHNAFNNYNAKNKASIRNLAAAGRFAGVESLIAL